MEDGDDCVIQNVNLKCNVCGETEFNVREGFYYCLECGTKQDQVRAIEVDQEEAFIEGQFAVKHKIQKKAVDHVELTSWECYNYILRGMVEELLNFGAKEELKRTVLQVWAAYLRRNEVAFFNKKKTAMPKLGIRYYQRDALAIYNHKAKKRKRRVRTRDVLSGDEERRSKRAFKKSKRKLDESAYSAYSAGTSQTDMTYESIHTDDGSSLDTLNTQAVQMSYSTAARKALKKVMPLRHLHKHESDPDGSLKCHKVRPKSRSINQFTMRFGTMNIKQVYAILGIALNVIGDDIQLSDLQRFIAEEHISVRNVLQYLPENVRERGRKLLFDIDFNFFDDKYSDKVMRDHICVLARGIPITGFQMPNMIELTRRYVSDLNLPPDFSDFVERLIIVLPPEMNTRTPHQYPHYEARAMAYIVFVAKSLFGLDGKKEQLISESAAELNKKLTFLKTTTNAGLNGRHQPLIFVWSEWLEYVEMRKLFVSRYNVAYSRQFKEEPDTDILIKDLIEKERLQKEDDHNHREVSSGKMQKTQGNIKRIFDEFLADSSLEDKTTYINFQPSLTPSSNYLKRLILHADTTDDGQITIPEILRVDHTQRSLMPFINATSLGAYLKACDFELYVEELECREDRKCVGIFRSNMYNQQYTGSRILKAMTDVTHEEWMKEIKKNETYRNIGLIFKKNLDQYNSMYMHKLEKVAKERTAHLVKASKDFDSLIKQKNSSGANNDIKKNKSVQNDAKLNKLTSIEAFSDDNMTPLKAELSRPRRNLDSEDLQKNNRDDESFIRRQPDESDSSNSDRILTLRRSNFDYWTLFGQTAVFLNEHKQDVFDKLPASCSWLLEVCANMIGVHWFVVYEQLMIIEMMFIHGIENFEDHGSCLRYTLNNPVKDINTLIRSFREMW